MNRLPELKSFLVNKADDYNVEVVFPGGDPKLVIMDTNGNEVEQISLLDKNEQQIIDLLQQKGFGKYEEE